MPTPPLESGLSPSRPACSSCSSESWHPCAPAQHHAPPALLENLVLLLSARGVDQVVPRLVARVAAQAVGEVTHVIFCWPTTVRMQFDIYG